MGICNNKVERNREMKNIVIFGASGGLGSDLVPLLEPHYRVTALSSKDVDITNREEVKRLFEENRFDIVLNMAAYNYNSTIHNYDDDKIEEIRRQVSVNIEGIINILSCCLPRMREEKYGRIISTSSILADKPLVGTAIYSASKSFMETFIRTAALENSRRNITCNCIQLGYFDGGLLYKIPEKIREQIRETIPLSRFGKVEEICNVIRMIVDTPYINGTTVDINGGL